uniref:Uncharacterized protein n=1 Tax=Chenopodium quinoa TaxID=63459 RepID=A0A803NBZ5_CHEQI
MKRRLMKQRELLNQMKLKLERWLKNYLRQIEVTELKEKLASLKAKFTLNTPLTQPSLMNWVAATPDGDIDSSNFRDPTTAWQAADGAWHVLIGGKAVTNEFEVDNTDFMEGITDWRYDYGSKYYASKTFFDGEKKRQTLWVRILEADGKANDKKKRVVRASVCVVPQVNASTFCYLEF